MFHVTPRRPKQGRVDYSKFRASEEDVEALLQGEIDPSSICGPRTARGLPEPDPSVPQAPTGFVFHRVRAGDDLVKIAIRYGVSQSKLRRFNRKACFGKRLSHIQGQLLVIPVGKREMTAEESQEVADLMREDAGAEHKEEEFEEPDEDGKFQLRRALQWLVKREKLDDARANYYLGISRWKVREAWQAYLNDEKWEKQQRVVKTLQCPMEDAKELLDICGWDVPSAIKHAAKHYHNKVRTGEDTGSGDLDDPDKRILPGANPAAEGVSPPRAVRRAICCMSG